MRPTDKPLPFVNIDKVVETATIEFLQSKFKNMTAETAALWARAIEMGERGSEMSPEMAEHIQKERDRASGILKELPFEVDRIRSEYLEALEANDVLSALDLHDEADQLGIDLSDIEKTTETLVDIKAILRGEYPSSGLS